MADYGIGGGHNKTLLLSRDAAPFENRLQRRIVIYDRSCEGHWSAVMSHNAKRGRSMARQRLGLHMPKADDAGVEGGASHTGMTL